MRRGYALTLALASLAAAPASVSATEDPLRVQQWNLDAINAEAGHRVSLGTGALVAVLDSGADSAHPDLAGSVVEGRDFIDGDQISNDQNGHGTSVTGIIVAHKDNGIGIEGAAPGAKVLSIRVLDAEQRGTSTQEIAGINAAVAAGADVINLSLNPTLSFVTQLLPLDPLVQSIDRASRAGVVVVAAAGNDNLPLCNQPILATKILCVGAVNRANRRSSYSNYEVRVDIVAPGGERSPGEGIASAQLGGGYSAYAGTSQATPHVTAAAALLVSLGLRGGAVIDRLKQTATPLGNGLLFGHGLLNMGAAVAGLGPDLPASAATLTARVPKRVRYRTLRRRGLSVVCTSTHTGRARVRVTKRGRLLARGSRQLTAAAPATVTAKLTAAGRRALRGSARIKARVTVSQTGSIPVRSTVTLARDR